LLIKLAHNRITGAGQKQQSSVISSYQQLTEKQLLLLTTAQQLHQKIIEAANSSYR
jgi:hypothetical protein